MSDIAATAVAMKQAQTQNTMQILMTKQAHEMDMSTVNMLTEAVASAKATLPAGVGGTVDKTA